MSHDGSPAVLKIFHETASMRPTLNDKRETAAAHERGQTLPSHTDKTPGKNAFRVHWASHEEMPIF